MPFQRPTLSALREQARAAFDSRLGLQADPQRRRNVKNLSDVMAGLVHLEYGYLDWMVGGVLMPDTAEGDYLERGARIVGINRLPAAAASGSILLTGTAGVTVPAGAVLQTPQGAAYATTAPVTLGSPGGAAAPVQAQVAGASGNLGPGAPMSLVTAIAGVAPQALVDASGLSAGADAESDDGLRARWLQRLRNPPQGGAGTDYVGWAKLVPGVTRAWAFPRNRGAGTADVTFTMDARPNIIPLPADVAVVQAQIDALRPVTADCQVYALTPDPLAVTIGSLYPNTAAVQAAIGAALAGFVLTAATPGNARFGDGVSPAQPGGTLWLSDLVDAIKSAAGVQHFDLLAPAADVVSAPGHIATLGTVSFV